MLGNIGRHLFEEIITAVAAGDLDTLRRLAADPDAHTRLALATSLDLPGEIAELLASGGAPGGPATDHPIHETAQLVAASAENLIRRIAMARAPSTKPESLRMLAEDRDSEVSAAVAAHPATPPDVLKQMARCGPGMAWPAIAQNPALPPELAAELVAGKWEYEDSIDYTPAVRAHLAGNPATPPEVLTELADAWPEEYETLSNLANNPSTPEATLIALTGSGLSYRTLAEDAQRQLSKRPGAAQVDL